MKENECDVLIIGAGAAGMMCAIQAGKRKRRTIILDHSSKIGRKILISGGGRCNFTNLNTHPGAFLSQNRHFCKSALSCYTPNDFIALVQKHKIAFHEKKLGQLFCDHSAEQIVNMLIRECREAQCEFGLNCNIESIAKNDLFIITTNRGRFAAQSLVIATGGISIPQIGATGFGYNVARQFGLKLVPARPALDGFTFTRADLDKFQSLSGISLDTILSCNGHSFRENVLFTHAGLSGPASLQASLYWEKALPIHVNLLPDCTDVVQWIEKQRFEVPKQTVRDLLLEIFPRRFVEKFSDRFHFTTPLASLSKIELNNIAQTIGHWQINPESTVGYKKAEVTKGGVDTTELSSRTMESKKVKGLYFIGEVVDVTGQLGGYNFQWAWSSGFAAGQNV